MDTLCDKTFITLKTGELVTEITMKEVFDYSTGLGALEGGQALRGTVGHDPQLMVTIVQTTDRLANSFPPSVWNNVQLACDVVVYSDLI